MIKSIRYFFVFLMTIISFSNLFAGEIEKNSRLDYSGFSDPSASLSVRYDKYLLLPFNSSSPIQLIASNGLVEFGFDETKKVFHADNLTSFLTFTYSTQDPNLTTTSNLVETLKITYNKNGEYIPQNYLTFSNVVNIDITKISIVTYKNYGLGSQSVVSNPKDLYIEANIKSNEKLLFDFANPLPAASQIGYNVININSGEREIEAYWDYIIGAEEYELEYIYVDNYEASSLSATKSNSLIKYDFEHDATRIITTNQYYRIPLVYEKGCIIFRVRGIGRVFQNPDVILEGTWSNLGYEKGTLDVFKSAFLNQFFEIQTAHESDNINWSSVRTFAEGGKSGIGVSYEDGVLHNRQSLAKLNTEEKIIAQASLYDWHGRPSISVLPAPINQNYFGYVQNLNRAAVGGQFDKNIFDNLSLNPSGACIPDGVGMDPVNSQGAAHYYSINNADKEKQQAFVPDAQGFPYVQIDYYADQTGRIKRQSLPGTTHKLGSGKEHQFFYVQPTQTELVRLFGTEVGTYDNYEKVIEVDPNGQTSVSYIDDEGRTIATALSGASPSNLLPLEEGVNTLPTPALDVLVNNNNDAQNQILSLTNNFEGKFGETQTIDYSVVAPVFTSSCVPNLCLDCIYELEMSLKDDCQNEYFDGDPNTAGNQPITKILGRYNPSASPTLTMSCPSDQNALSFSLSSPSPFTFVIPKTGSYHLVKTLKLSTAPIQQYAEEFVKQNTCIKTLEDFQEQYLSNIDITGCESLDCASCSTSVMSLVASLPPNSLTQIQIDELMDKCELKCDVKNPCTAKEKLMLMHFKPNGYFAKYDVSFTSSSALSIFNPNNNLNGILTFPSSSQFWYANPPTSYPSGYTVVDPATSNVVTPNQLSALNYIGTFSDSYSEPWLKWHPEYCKLKYECDAFINALKNYSEQIEGILSYDEACRKGLLIPLQGMTSFANAPLASNCNGCSTPIYEPFNGLSFPSGSTFFDNIQINNNLSTLLNSVLNMSYSDANGNSVNANIYQFAIAAAASTTTNQASPSFAVFSNFPNDVTTSFGNNPCTKDREWLFFKQFYLALKNNLLNSLKQSFISSWQLSNGGCLQNFSALPGYIKIFPDQSTVLASNPLMSNYSSNSNSSSVSQSIPTTQLAQQCSDYCQSYVNNWLQDLSACFVVPMPNPTPAVWTNISNDLLAVCKGGCDSQDPFGASNTNTNLNITVNGHTYSVSDFNSVINAYKTEGLIINNVNCSGYAISFPKPKGSSLTGASSTSPKLDVCGCDALLDIHAAYVAAVVANPSYSCTVSESEFASQNYNINLSTYNDYICACNQAKTGPSSYDFNLLSELQLTTLILPENLACKQCKSCNDISKLNEQFQYAFGSAPLASIDHDVLQNWLNGLFNMNNSYSEWLEFIQGCNTAQNTIYTSNVSQNANDVLNLLNNLSNNHFLLPNISAPNPYVLNLVNGSSFFATPLWSNLNPAAGVTSPSLDIRVDATNLVLYSGINYFTIDVRSNSTSPSYNLKIRLKQSDLALFTNPENSIVFNKIYAICRSSDKTTFTLELNITNGGVTSQVLIFGYLDGANSFQVSSLPTNLPPSVGNNACAPYLCSHSLDQEPLPTNPCIQNLINNALNSAQTDYQNYITLQVNEFIANYKNYCYANVTEQTKRGYTINEYNYTLYYYDRAGNLVHTVPPKGVDIITNPTDISNAINYVTTGNGNPFYPKHSINPSNPTSPTPAIDPTKDGVNRYITNYQYNTFDAPLSEITPDGGETKYFYDHVGRLVASQNAKQAAEASYAYTLYDDFGRITEVGVLYLSTALGDDLTETTLKNPVLLKAFLTGSYHLRKEITQSYYDVPLNATSNALFNVYGGQQNTRERVTATTYEKVHDDNKDTYDYATFYSYDDHGNVNHLIHDNPVLNTAGSVNQYKYIDYEYELISGNVKKVTYQKNKPDQYYHKYIYDNDNRLHEVYTSRNDIVYTKDAKYFYYQHGPLARVETGEKQVQGTDYVYTIQGWIKGVNSTILSETTDAGKDGNKSNQFLASNAGIHQNFAKDAASYSLNYFGGDYNPIKSASSNFIADMTALNNSTSGVGFKKSVDAPDLYNGNIASMITSIYDMRDHEPSGAINPDFEKVKPQFTAYRYDQLQRIRQMKAYSTLREMNDGIVAPNQAIDLANNSWNVPTSQNYVGIYEMTLDYDRNGNILYLNRKGEGSVSGSGVWSAREMDQLTYKYNTNPAGIYTSIGTIDVNNQLRQVNDGPTGTFDAAYVSNYIGTDIDNQTDANNYKYNPIGSLEQDISEQIDKITWTAAKKVKSVERLPGSTKPDLYFEYNAFGQRISKTVVPRPGGTPDQTQAKTTYYVLDASGNQLAFYMDAPATTAAGTRTFKCTEHVIFGSGRVGIDNTTIDMLVTPALTNKIDGVFGTKDYECDNHLGNVISTISDRKIQEAGNTVTLFNDFETAFNYQSNTQPVSISPNTCQLFFPTQEFGPSLETLVYPGDNVTADIQSYYTNPTPVGDPSPGILVLAFVDVNGNALYSSTGTVQWFQQNASTPGVWESLTNSQIVPVTLYTDIAHTTIYYGNVYAKTLTWNHNTNNIWFDNHSLTVNPVDPIVGTYKPEIKSTADYYAFGMALPGRTYAALDDKYKYGFNGKESDIDGEFDAYDFGARSYNERLGRWMSTDAHQKTYPGLSPYQFAFNSPNLFKDPDGNDGRISIIPNANGLGGKIIIETVVYLFGPDAKAGMEKALNDEYANLLGTVGGFTDVAGNEWSVEISVKYSTQNIEDINRYFSYILDAKGNVISSSIEHGCPLPTSVPEDLKTQIKGFKDGDNFLFISNSCTQDNSMADYLSRSINSISTMFHETFHLMDLIHTYALSNYSSIYSDKVDIMEGGASKQFHNLKNKMIHPVHYFDIVRVINRAYKGVKKVGEKIFHPEGKQSNDGYNKGDDIQKAERRKHRVDRKKKSDNGINKKEGGSKKGGSNKKTSGSKPSF